MRLSGAQNKNQPHNDRTPLSSRVARAWAFACSPMHSTRRPRLSRFWLVVVAVVALPLFLLQSQRRTTTSLALIYPVTEADVENLFKNMRGNYVSATPACRGSAKVDVILYFPRQVLLAERHLDHLRRSLRATGDCWGKFMVRFAEVPLERDLYPLGVNEMFYSLYRSAFLLPYDSFFWMEYDVLPLKALWLDRLLEEARDSFLVKGSVFRGSKFDGKLSNPDFAGDVWTWLPHINGNALWATPTKLPAILEVIGAAANETRSAFDVAVYEVLFGLPALTTFRRMQRFAPLYRYASFIQNWAGSETPMFTAASWKLQNLDTFLVHANPLSARRQKVMQNSRTLLGKLSKLCPGGCFLPAQDPVVLCAAPEAAAVGFVPIQGTGSTWFMSRLSERSPLLSLRVPELQRIDAGYGFADEHRSFELYNVTGISSPQLIRFILRSDSSAFLRALRRPFAYMAIFREPTERLLNHYNDIRKNRRDNWREIALSKLSFENFVISQSNLMSYTLGLSSDANWTIAELEFYLSELFCAVGIFEEMGKFVVFTHRLLGLAFPTGGNPWLPPNEKYSFHPTGEQLEWVEKNNQLDILLYRAAKRIAWQQQASLRNCSELDAFLLAHAHCPSLLQYWNDTVMLLASKPVSEENVYKEIPLAMASATRCDAVLRGRNVVVLRNPALHSCGAVFQALKQRLVPVCKNEHVVRRELYVYHPQVYAEISYQQREHMNISFAAFVSGHLRSQFETIFGKQTPTAPAEEWSRLLETMYHSVAVFGQSQMSFGSTEREVIELYLNDDRVLYEAAKLAVAKTPSNAAV